MSVEPWEICARIVREHADGVLEALAEATPRGPMRRARIAPLEQRLDEYGRRLEKLGEAEIAERAG